MRKRVLALLLAGIMIFNSESIIVFAAEHNSDTVTEASAEQETESEEEEDSSELQQEDATENATEKETVVGTETDVATETSAGTETGVEAGSSAETETSVETETSIEAEETDETDEEETSAETVTETGTEDETEHTTEKSIVLAEESTDFNYTLSGNNATITGYTGSDTEVLIPDTIDGYTVTAIGNYAFRYNHIITDITIPDSIASIGNNAFYDCTSLASVSLGDNVTSLGNSAFYGCTSLTSASLGDGVTSIGSSLFYGCTSLASVSLGSGVTSIGNYAFQNCKVLTGISLGNNLTAIGTSSFEGCEALTSIKIPKSVTSIGNSAFKNSISEIEFEDGITQIPSNACREANNLTKVAIPATVTSIGTYAFYSCKSLTAITLPDNVEALGNSVFYGCTALTGITMGASVTSIGSNAFQDCTALTSVSMKSNVTSIGSSAFENCTSLNKITIPRNVTSIGSNAFKNSVSEIEFENGMPTIPRSACNGANNLTKVTIPATVTAIGSSAFYGCSMLASISIGNNVSSIENDAFNGCAGLTGITLENGLEKIGSNCFANCTSLKNITIPRSITSIGRNAFNNSVTEITFAEGIGTIPENACYGANKLEKITLPSTAVTIGYFAFYGCISVTSVALGDNITELGDSAFNGCTGLTQINIPSSVTRIGSSAFSGCNMITEMDLGDSLTTIGASAFSGCTLLTSLVIPKNVTSIGRNAFNNSVTEITFAEGMEAIPENACNGANKLTTITIPSTVKTVSAYAFSGCTSITSVTLRDGIIELGDSAFNGCTGLNEINIPSSVARIGASAFSGCNMITEMNLGDSLTTIGASAFSGCTLLTSLVIPKNVTSIGRNAFYNSVTEITFAEGMETIPENACNGANKLTAITIPSTVKIVSAYAFSGCTSITSVTLRDGITELGDSAFNGCTGLNEINIPSSMTKIGSSAFSGCNKITEIDLGDSLTSIGASAFNGCTLLTSLVIPKNVTSIGRSAFYNSVTEITFAEGMETIPENACNGANKLTAITIPSTVKIVSAYAFSGCTSITSVTLDEGITVLGDSAFNGCTGLAEIKIPDSVAEIGSSAFYGCNLITEMKLGDSLTTIGASAFYGCTLLTSLVIPKNVTSIGRNAFYNSVTEITFAEGMATIPENACNGANKLTTITIPGTVKIVGAYAFSNCTLMTDIALNDGITELCEYAFYYCTGLERIRIPDNTKVGNNCFYNCTGITEIVIGDNVTLGDYVFRNCNNIVSIKIGKNLTKTDLSFGGAVLKGECGDNLTWELSIGAGTLEINGSGDMEAFSSADDVPWGSLGSLVQTLSISEDISTISAYAFQGFDNIDSIIIPEKVTSIGDRAFDSCDSLRYVEVPENVRSIGIEAFDACGSLEEIVFCGDAPTLGNACMPDESSLTVYYPETATGWIARLIDKFKSIKWKKWDNTAPTKDVVLVLDTSGSMSGRMGTLKEASSRFIDAVGGRLYNTRIAIVEYNSYAYVLSGFSTDKKGQIKKVNELDSNGGTEYMNALNRADSLLQGSKADYRVIVMFSDGEPNDSQQGISELAAKLRKSYYIYTVGLISEYYYGDNQQRQILIDVAGSADRYFEASNIEGLVEAFLSLAEDIGRDENTTVEIKRHNKRYDLLSTEEAFCVNSPEFVSIYVTPGTKHADVTSISLVQNGQEIVENDTGEFENIVPGNIFEVGQKVYAVLHDSKGAEIERLALMIDMREYFVITYNLNDGKNTIYKTQNVINGEEIYEPDRPERAGYVFRGWYASDACTGFSFFSNWNIYNRAAIEGDVTLYAKWRYDSFDILDDGWSFLNNDHPFHCKTKEISPGDYSKLIEGLDEGTKEVVRGVKDKEWNGSCFGMSSSAVLMNAGVFSLTNFDSRYSVPGDVITLEHNVYGDADVKSIESMINFYHLRQVIGNVKDITYDFEYDRNNEAININNIINKMEADKRPVVLNIWLYTNKFLWWGGESVGGHAVVAYDLVKNDSTGSYTFKVYDCTMGNGHEYGKDYNCPIGSSVNGYGKEGKEYVVTVNKNGEVYKKSCKDWEKSWGYDIVLCSALTVDDLQTESILTAPSVILSKSTEAQTSDTYVLCTSYGSFTITDGSNSAIVSGGVKVSGDLDITCCGLVSYVGEEPEFKFMLPTINGSEGYTIMPETAQIYAMGILYQDCDEGFYSSVNASDAGTITISATGEITTKYADMTSQTIKSTRNNMPTSWYNITVSGEDTGFNVKVGQSKTEVVSDHAVNTDISVNNDFNYINFTDIPLDDTGVDVVEGSNGECRIEKDGKVIATNGFGYSVVFDSQCGTPIDTLVNVTEGSVIAEPGDPQRDGYIFEGWFKEKTCENLWDFASDKVTDNVVLYAGWSIDANYFVTVTFKTPGHDSQTIYTVKGNQIERGDCPAIEENEDQNWYKDDKYTTAWDFVNDVVMENTTLYAKGKNCTVTFVTNCETKIDAQVIYAGSYLTEPKADLEKAGYTMCGWSSDDQFSEDWDFDSDKILGDTTLYVRWVENEKDKNGNDTKICIEILRPNSYVYNGKPVTPGVVVRDGGKILEVNKDYKISYKNNTAAGGSGSKMPQIIIQGIGAYKSNKKITKYFSIQKADIADLSITLPEYVAAKANDKLQQIKPVVRTNSITLSAKNYTIAYYKDAELKNAVPGLSSAGTYFIVIEAKKDSVGTYTGNFKGKSSPILVNVASPKAVLSSAKVSYTKKIDCVKADITSDEAVQRIVTQVVMDGKTYATADMDTFRQYFAVTAADADGSMVSQEKLASILKTAGTKTITISAVSGNTEGYVGNTTINLTVQGTKLNRNQFRLTYNTSSQSAVTSAEYTGKALVPNIISELTEGTDYTVSYLYNKKTIKASRIINAGSYTAVINGMNQYSGTLSIKFTVKKADLAKAYAAGKITITSNGTAIQNLAGAKVAYTVSYDADADSGSDYKKIMLSEGTDYMVTYKNNTKASTNKACAYAVITGRGNFAGTLKGDGKPNSTNSIAKLLNYTITRKALSSSDIQIVVSGITLKKGNPKVKYNLYDNGRKIAPGEYTDGNIQVSGNTVTLTIRVPNKVGKAYNYTGYRTETMPVDLTRASDAKKVKIAYKDNSKHYYTGTRVMPEITIKDADGTDISENFTVEYGENTAVGRGTVTISGKLENGYCDTKVLKFTILPRWMKWIF